MKAYCILAFLMAFAFTLSSCQPQAKVQTQQLDGRTFTTMSHGDLTLTHVELDKSTAVVFRAVAGGGLDTIDPKCLTCTISKISECAGPDPAASRACVKKKCEEEGSCKANLNFSFGIIRL